MKILAYKKGDETGGTWPFVIKLLLVIGIIVAIILVLLIPLKPYLMNIADSLFGWL